MSLKRMQNMEQEADLLNVRIMQIKPADEDYLYYVLCHSKSEKQYITWLYNDDMGGFHAGHYFNYFNRNREDVYKQALDDFNKR